MRNKAVSMLSTLIISKATLGYASLIKCRCKQFLAARPNELEGQKDR